MNEARQHDQVIVVGSSLGGLVAAHVAEGMPNDIAQLPSA